VTVQRTSLRRVVAVATMRRSIWLFAVVLLIGGCGKSDGPDASARPANSAAKPSLRYHPGWSDCRARTAPGTVGHIGEDVASRTVPILAFRRCYGRPVREHRHRGEQCLSYRQRGQATYWSFCVRDGFIVSAAGNQRSP
jgi:hypothetical protein